MARISAAEKERRVHELTQMLANGKRTSECLRFASETWGISKRQSEVYLRDARAVIRADYSAERSEFMAAKLANLDLIQEKAMQSNQLSAAVGAIRLAAELTQLVR